MPISLYLVILVPLILLFPAVYLWRMRNHDRTSAMPTNWPLVGMMPELFKNADRVFDMATDILIETGGTFMFKGPWFSNMDYVFTADPSNIQHVLSKKFSNYPKGPEFRKRFDIFGDALVNSDSELFQLQRKTTKLLMHHPNFQDLLEGITRVKVEKGLIPFLANASANSRVVDLQDMFQRLTFDSICMLLLDYDPMSLSIELPFIRCRKAFRDTEEAICYRHVFPEIVWKLQRKLRIGKEGKMSEAWETIDEFIYRCISLKEEKKRENKDNGTDFSLLTSFMEAYKETSGTSGDTKKFLRDTLFNLMVAGSSGTGATLTRFFLLLSRNPLVEIKIHEEIKTKITNLKALFKAEELEKLVYLHGALCETLRLYPPVPLEYKAPVEMDTLPSGHQIKRNTKILLFFYSTGRMETVWGRDCLEFKPERWITESGGIKHQPFYKFPAFHGGPRTCLGMDMAFTQMKAIAASFICNYRIDVVEDRPIIPSRSIMLVMKHGLNVTITNVSP